MFSKTGLSSDYSASINSVDQFLAFSTRKEEVGYNNELRSDTFEDNIEECNSRREPREKLWQCPYCYNWWELGERCKNDKCPTNQWKKEKKEDREKKKDKR